MTKDRVGEKIIDTGFEGAVVCLYLVDDDQLTEKCWLVVRIDNTVLLAEKTRIQVKTPYLSGEVEVLSILEAICDLVVGNASGVRESR